jgi:hypothetical protein
MAIDLLNI